LGVEWKYAKNVGGGRTIGTALNNGNLGTPLSTLSGYSALATGNDFEFLVKALHNDGRLEVLSRPQILTLENQPAIINVGQRVPLITDSRVTVQGDTINSFRYENVGINLQITAHIGEDGMVKLDVGTTNSSISSSTVEINKNATVPIINERRATTTVSVQNGQTVIIGGLMGRTKTKGVSKVPFLGDIPLLGAAFRRKTTTDVKTELLIFLTPHVVPAPTQLSALSASEREKVNIKPNAITEQELNQFLDQLPMKQPDEKGAPNPSKSKGR